MDACMHDKHRLSNFCLRCAAVCITCFYYQPAVTAHTCKRETISTHFMSNICFNFKSSGTTNFELISSGGFVSLVFLFLVDRIHGDELPPPFERCIHKSEGGN